MARFIHKGDSIDYTPTSADVSAGEVVVQGDLVGIAKLDIPKDTLGAIAVTGVFDAPKATDAAITAGAKLYWHPTTKIATPTASGAKYLGKAVAAAAEADPTVRVRLEQ